MTTKNRELKITDKTPKRRGGRAKRRNPQTLYKLAERGFVAKIGCEVFHPGGERTCIVQGALCDCGELTYKHYSCRANAAESE